MTNNETAQTKFRILNLDGGVEQEHTMDGKIRSLAVSSTGDLFMTKQFEKSGADKSTIFKCVCL